LVAGIVLAATVSGDYVPPYDRYGVFDYDWWSLYYPAHPMFRAVALQAEGYSKLVTGYIETDGAQGKGINLEDQLSQAGDIDVYQADANSKALHLKAGGSYSVDFSTVSAKGIGQTSIDCKF
jgi:hypothetical protein